MTEPPHSRIHHGPVKERSEPVSCTECGRVNWSSQSLCVYCRLGWPDPGDMRGMPPDREGVGHLRLDQPSPPARAGQRETPAVHRTSDGQVLREVAVDVAGRFVEDVTCVRCRYNLRGLRHADLCPECGGLVEDSLRVHDMAVADPRWLRALSEGGWLLFSGMVAVAISPVLFFFILIAAAVPLLLGLMLIVVGLIRLTTPQSEFEHAYEMLGINETARRITRWSILGVSLSVFCAFVLLNGVHMPIGLLAAAILFGYAMIGVCGTFAMILMSNYGRCLNRPDIANQLTILAWIHGLMFGVTVMFEVLVLAVAASVPAHFGSFVPCVAILLFPLGIWALVVVALLAAALDSAAKIAEGSAHVSR